MKINLQNRPRTLTGSKPTDTPLDTIEKLQKQICETEEWFEDLEKELQHIVDLLSEPSEFATEFGAGRLSLAKEILGE